MCRSFKPCAVLFLGKWSSLWILNESIQKISFFLWKRDQMESKFLKFHIFWKINTIYNFYLNLTLLTHLLEYRLFKELHVSENKGLCSAQHDTTTASQQGLPSVTVFFTAIKFNSKSGKRNLLEYYMKLFKQSIF
jgi:hypothetical protein